MAEGSRPRLKSLKGRSSSSSSFASSSSSSSSSSSAASSSSSSSSSSSHSSSDAAKMLDDETPMPSEFAAVLKDYQAEGVRFLWKRAGPRAGGGSGGGCILADHMGLGKTIQVIAFLRAYFAAHRASAGGGGGRGGGGGKKRASPGSQPSSSQGRRRVLVVCPAITVRNWKNEFAKWLPQNTLDEIGVDMMDAQSCKQRKQRITRMLAWGKNGGVMIIGYEMLRTIIQVALRTEVKSVPLYMPFQTQDVSPTSTLCLYPGRRLPWNRRPASLHCSHRQCRRRRSLHYLSAKSVFRLPHHTRCHTRCLWHQG